MQSAPDFYFKLKPYVMSYLKKALELFFLFSPDVSQSVRIPVLIGSGVTHDNLERYIDANGVIVGSHFKEGGHWANVVDPRRVHTFMKKRNSLLSGL